MDHQEIELTLSLGEYGWSYIKLDANGENYAFVLTHVFNNPIAEFLNAFTSLLNSVKTSRCILFDEPGAYKWEMELNSEQQHIIDIQVSEYESCGEWNETDRQISEFEFSVKLQHISACIYSELIRLNELMKIKTYKLNRNHEYPANDIKAFIEAYERRYS